MTEQGMQCFAEIVAESKSLRQVYLEDSGITNEKLRYLVPALKKNTNITKLFLFSNYIGDEGAELLSEILQLNTAVLDLQLMGNMIGARGAQTIAEALKQNTILETLNLGSNPIPDEGVQYISNMLEKNISLTHLRLAEIQAGDNGALALANALRINTTLTYLSFGSNNLRERGSGHIAAMLKQNTSLKTLILSNLDPYHQLPLGRVCEALRFNTTLIKLRPSQLLSEEGKKLLEMNTRYQGHPLHLAACKGRLEVVQRLLLEGHNITANHDEDGSVFEAMARWSGELGLNNSSRDIIYALKSAGAKYEKGPFGILREMMIRLHVSRDEESAQDGDECEYYWRMREGAAALPFMKASYSLKSEAPLVKLPPEMLERVYMYCTSGKLSVGEVRRLYPAGILFGMVGMTDREIVHAAIVRELQVLLSTTRVRTGFVGGEGEGSYSFTSSGATNGAASLFTCESVSSEEGEGAVGGEKKSLFATSVGTERGNKKAEKKRSNRLGRRR